MQCVNSISFVDMMNENDIVLQMARCEFDVHILDIVGSLTLGATVAMVRPEGYTSVQYLLAILNTKQITYMDTVPSVYESCITAIKSFPTKYSMEYVRSLISGGMYILEGELFVFHLLFEERKHTHTGTRVIRSSPLITHDDTLI